jgi:hypothetical protein
MDLKKLTSIVKNFKSIAVVYDAKDLEWYIYDEDYVKEPAYDRRGEKQKDVYNVNMEIAHVSVGDFEEGDELLNELAELKQGDTVLVKSLVLEESPGKYFSHAGEEKLKIKSIEIKRNQKNLYDVYIEINPIIVPYKEGSYSDDYADYKYQEWKDSRNER